MENNANYIYGRNAVIEALNANAELEKVFLMYGIQPAFADKIRFLCKKANVPCVVFDKKKFENLEKQACPDNSKSQGVIASKTLVDTISVEELIEIAFSKEKNPVIVALDEINDPHNLGAIARSVECSGAIGIIQPERNSAPISATAVKISAGALELVPVAKTTNFNRALELLKEAGFWIIGTEMNADSEYSDDIYNMPIVIVIGNEGKGMRPSTAKHCDKTIKIPMSGKINSLNASVSAGIILFEIARQKRKFVENV